MITEKPIPEYDGYFAKSDGTITYLGKILKQYIGNKQGHVRVWIKKPHWRKCYPEYVHRLVAQTWVNNTRPDILGIVDHIDQNPKNNCVSNLRWSNKSLNASNNSSMGCYFDKISKKWNAQCQLDGVRHSVGYFDTQEEAHEASKTFRENGIDRLYKELSGPVKDEAPRSSSDLLRGGSDQVPPT